MTSSLSWTPAGADSVADLVAERAARTPEALAVADSRRRLTYRDLDARAERLANRLRSLGVGPDVIVGLCLKSSPALVVGALGILKAGGAYLALDPALPVERLDFLLNDAKPRLLVTAACLADRLPEGDWHTIGLDEYGWDHGPEPPPRRAVPQTVDNLAYVIYTSGSTGQPKGVEVTGRGLLNLVRWHRRAFLLTARDRATQIAGVGFDAAVWELWPCLTAGASLHVPDDRTRQDPEALRDWMVAERITITFVPTPMAERMIGLAWPEDAALRTMLTGADVLHRHTPHSLPFTLVNNYGPTECAVVATSGPVRPDDRPGAMPTIGRPIDNVRVHVLDEQLRPVPAGTAGELCIGGAGVGRGYLHRPELTAQKFVKDPFSAEPGARLYRTGDLGRLLPDGQFAFLGRLDDQVKVRGYRVEPAEIVAALAAHPGIRESAVVARDAGHGEKRLVAYVVPAAGACLAHAELRDFLAVRLPDYMVPATFVALGALPLGPSGKVDRAALPAPDEASTLRDETLVAPRTPVEARVAGILAPLLGLPEVGVDDNFFMLGGHSMLGTQLIARLREVFAVDLTLRTLFDTPTVAGLAAAIEALLVDKLQAMSDGDAERMLG